MSNKNIVNNGVEFLLEEASKCGMEFEFFNDEKDGILDDDDVLLSFSTSIKCADFNTDDGMVKPEPIVFELTYDRSQDEFQMTIGEDTEYPITYGNVMAYMYFSAIQSA